MKPETLNRYTPLFPVPDRSFDRFEKRRVRKERNRRLGALVLALVIAAASTATTIEVFRTAPQRTPADQLTPSTVGQLALAWKAPSNGSLLSPVVSGGVAYVASFGYEYAGGSAKEHVKTGRVYAYPVECAAGGARCQALWYGETKKAATPVVSGDAVYALTSFRNEVGELFSFPVGCATDGSACDPTWTAFVGRSTGSAIVAADGMVYVASTRGVLAFAADCGSGGEVCEPSSRVQTDLPVTSIVVTGDALIVGTSEPFSFSDPTVDRGAIYAFPLSCSDACHPIWVDRSVGQVSQLRVVGSAILVGTNGGQFGHPALRVFPTSCATDGGACKLLWTADLHGVCCPQLSGTPTQAVVADYLGVFAFPLDCRTDGGSCDPTWESDLSGFPYDTPGPLIESGPPVIGDGVVFAEAGLNSGTVYAFGSDCVGSCKPLWTGEITGAAAFDAAVDGDHLLVAGSDGLYAFAPRAGEPPPPGPSKSAPIFYGAIAAAALLVLVIKRRRSEI